MKFTLMTDDVWSGKKITYEFDEDSLPKILENFEYFLKANGFEFDGYLDFTNPEPELNEEYYFSEFHDGDFDLNIGDLEIESTTSNLEKCPVCYIDKKIMQNHKCFDSKCPKDTW